jgi:hypothetical protein
VLLVISRHYFTVHGTVSKIAQARGQYDNLPLYKK